MTSLATLLERAADVHGDRPALIHGEQVTSYAELWRESRQVAGDLVRRIAPGDRVVLQLPNSRAFVTAFYGIVAAGGVAVPLPIGATGVEHAAVVANSGPAVVLSVGDVWLGSPERAVIPRADDDHAAILYTSGTSGDPKGVVLTQRNLLSNATVASRDVARFTADDVMMVTVQFAHAFGLTSVLNACLYAGTTLVVMDRWEASGAWDLIRRHGVTVIRGVPTTFLDLLAAMPSGGCPPLRAVFSGGAAMPPALLARVENACATTVWEGYGLTEASPLVACNQRSHGRRPGTVGHAVPGVDVQLVDPAVRDALVPVGRGPGEVVVRGPNVMAGYWQRPAETADAIVAGWLRTGDVGTVDDDGFLRITDRLTDVITRGGAAVYPREVEDVLLAHPCVRQAAVVGAPDDRYGQRVTAVIVTENPVSVDELRAWCRASLASYKCPVDYRFADDLPRGPTGKLLRRAL